MGLLDGLLGSLIGKLSNNQQGNLLSSVGGMLQGTGGIQGLLGKFAGHGLGDMVKGWISTGPNPPATGQQIEQVMGAQQLDQIAQQTGIPRDQIAGHVAQVLPQVVDKLTPDGKPPEGNALQDGLSALMKGGLGKLFGG